MPRLAVFPLFVLTALPLSAQRHHETAARPSGPPAYSFAPALHAGQRLRLSNIDGDITVTTGAGDKAEILVYKAVTRGDGNRVQAVLEQTNDGYRVCAVYLQRSGDAATCEGSHNNGQRNDDPLDVTLRYDVRLPAGIALTATTVDGDVSVHGANAESVVTTVDGSIDFEGIAPRELRSVDGDIQATITDSHWAHDVAIQTVDGAISVTMPAGVAASLSGRSVDGQISANFPVTLAGKWGPRSFTATLGTGASAALRVHSVDGQITLHRGDRQ